MAHDEELITSIIFLSRAFQNFFLRFFSIYFSSPAKSARIFINLLLFSNFQLHYCVGEREYISTLLVLSTRIFKKYKNIPKSSQFLDIKLNFNLKRGGSMLRVLNHFVNVYSTLKSVLLLLVNLI